MSRNHHEAEAEAVPKRSGPDAPINRAAPTPVRWARLGTLARLVASAIPLRRPPLLILSLPRTGSSWVGTILGAAPEALYLREPITQGLPANDYGHGVRVIRPDEDALFANLAHSTFSGLPVFPRVVVPKARQWGLLHRARRRLVIKEVNPLLSARLVEQYQPRIVFLVRHPAAVALSFQRLGWMDVDLDSNLGPTLASTVRRAWNPAPVAGARYYARHGAFQGAVLRVTIDALSTHTDLRVVSYEHLCADPLTVFRGLFDFAQLTWSADIQEMIRERSVDGDRGKVYNTYRNSLAMIDAWRGELASEDLLALREAYSAFRLPWYARDEDW